MRKCRRCGRELSDEDITCPYCTAVEKNNAAVNGVMLDGIALKDGDEADRKYQEQRNGCAICGRKLKSDWKKEHGICVPCNLVNEGEDGNREKKRGNNNVAKNNGGGFLSVIGGAVLLIFAFKMIAGDSSGGITSNATSGQDTVRAQVTTAESAIPLEDQLEAIGISSENLSSDVDILRMCGIKSIAKAEKKSDSYNRVTYVVGEPEDRVITLMVRDGRLFYAGVNGKDVCTQSGVVAKADDYLEEHEIDDATEEKIKSAMTDAIKSSVKYPDTVSVYKREWKIDRRGNTYTVYAYAAYSDALSNEQKEHFYATLEDRGGNVEVLKMDTWNSLKNEAQTLLGTEYGNNIISRAQNYAYSNEAGCKYLRRMIDFSKILVDKGIKPIIANVTASSLTLMCDSIASDIGFDDSEIYRRLYNAYVYDDLEGLSVLGVDLPE